MGSGAYVQMTHTLLAATDYKEGGKILVRIKNNLGEDGGGYLYEMVPTKVTFDDGNEGPIAKIVPGEYVDGSAEDLMVPPIKGGSPAYRSTQNLISILNGIRGLTKPVPKAVEQYCATRDTDSLL